MGREEDDEDDMLGEDEDEIGEVKDIRLSLFKTENGTSLFGKAAVGGSTKHLMMPLRADLLLTNTLQPISSDPGNSNSIGVGDSSIDCMNPATLKKSDTMRSEVQNNPERTMHSENNIDNSALVHSYIQEVNQTMNSNPAQ